jgi:glyoxylase-like metal-dependent hydrolase (beta-lactamase superfamily II)
VTHAHWGHVSGLDALSGVPVRQSDGNALPTERP